MLVPIETPFTKNSTLATVPSISVAEALIVTTAGAKKWAPVTGEVILTVGAWLGATNKVSLTDVLVIPSFPVAIAVKICVPVTPV